MRRITSRRRRAIAFSASAAAAALLAVQLQSSSAQSINLQFNGSGNTVAATGFDAAYNPDPTGFNVGGGNLTIQTQPGDIFGDYEDDPDTAKNVFYSNVASVPTRTVIETKVTFSDLNANFHGGGIWMGTDEDHYVRMGAINNSFQTPPGVTMEALRENEDLWPGAVPPGPGNDIQDVQTSLNIPTPQETPATAIMRIVRDGHGASMFYSLDNGATFTRLPVPGFTFDNVVTGPGQGFNNGASIEGGYKVGLFAFGGPEGQIPATFAFDYFTANGGTDTWNLPGSGVYDNDSSWTLLTPSSVDATALFGSSITSDATVTINGEHNVGTVTFDSTHSYTIAGAGTLTFNSWDTYSGTTPVTVPAGINVLNGNHTISSNVNMAKSMVVNVVNGTNSVTITNGLASTGTLTTLTKTGAGALILKNLNLAAGAAVNAGTVSILPNGTNDGTSRLGTLSLGGGATPTGSFDLNDNDLVITSGDEATVQGWVRNARNNGNWNQPGLTSSTARTNPSHNTTIGVLSGAEYKSMNGASSTFDGSPVADTDVLAKYTYYGDTDFNGKVNFDDYVRTDNGFNNHLSGWMNGDFDLNGQVNFDDYVLIDLAFNTQSGTLGRALGFVDGSDGSVSGMDNPALRQVQRDVAQFGDAYVRGFLAAVPEPAAFGMLAAMAILGATNRRRRQK